MEADAQKFSMSLQVLGILSAIPLTMFALWADYYSRRIERMKLDKEPIDQELESARIRLTSVSVILFLLLLLLGSTPLRRQHPLAVNGILIFSILIQGWMQALLERKLGYTQPNVKDQLKKALLALVWIAGSVLSYIAVVVACTSLFGYVGQLLTASKPMHFALTSIGAIFGLIGGMALNFALAPLHLRKLIPGSPLESEFPILAENCREAFRSCDLAVPSLYLMQRSAGRGTTAFISGFRRGRGIFRPALFISRELIEKLTPSELKAVIYHELSHVLLNHLVKRFLFSAGLVGGLTLAGVALTFLTSWALPKDPTAQQLMPILAIGAFFMAFRWIGHQSQKHEVEADYYAVTRLAVELRDFASALRKLDQLNGISPDQSGRMHPSTELRIAVLEHVLGNSKVRALKSTTATPESKDNDKKKAA